MPPVRPPRKSDFHYPHEELFFWILVGVAALMAFSSAGIYFFVALVVGSWLWALVIIIWMLWRSWYIDREEERLRDRNK